MVPIGDVIPTRARPVLTAALALAAFALVGPPGLRPFIMAWAADALAIWTFGRTLEDRMGRARFALFAAIGASAAPAVAALAAPVPAALAVAGGLAAALAGGYLSRYPQAPALALVPLPFRLEIIEIPAWFIAGVWAVVHVATVLGAATNATALALLTGWLAAAAVGALAATPLSRRERDDPDWWGA